MGSWSRDMKKPNTPTKSDNGTIKGDEFPGLITNATSKTAVVSVNYGESMEFGSTKIAATVTLHCDQTESMINKAGGLAFHKALELVQDGWSVLKGT